MVCALRACWPRACWPRANLSLVMGRVWACDGAMVRWSDAMERCHSDPVLRMRMLKPKQRQPFVLFEEHLTMPGQLDEGANDAECRYLETASLRGQTLPSAQICLVFLSCACASNRSRKCSVSDHGFVRQCFTAGYTNVEICSILSGNRICFRCVLYKHLDTIFKVQN